MKILNWQKFNENISIEQKEFIEDQLYNASEHMEGEQDMINWFVENGIDRAFATRIVNAEMDNCLRDPMYKINWNNYGINENISQKKYKFIGDTLGGNIIDSEGNELIELSEEDILETIENWVSIKDFNEGKFDVNVLITRLKEKNILKESKENILNWEKFNLKGGMNS